MSLRTPRSSRALLVGLCCLSGCFDDCGGYNYDPSPGPGELGNGDFYYYCNSTDDPACPEGYDTGPFPARFLIGGEFRLSYTFDDATLPTPELRSGAEDRLATKGEVFSPLVEGYTAVLAMSAGDVGDLIHLYASVPTQVAVQWDLVDLFELPMSVGDELTLRAITRDGEGYILAGTRTFAFAIDDPTVATIVGTTAGSLVVHGVAAGTTTLRASLGELTAEIPVTVADVAVTTGETSTGTTGESTGEATGSSGSSGDGGSSGGGESSSGSSGGVL